MSDYASETNHYKLFKRTYWGSLNKYCFSDKIFKYDKNIIKNRNDIAEKLNLKQCYPDYSFAGYRNGSDLFDHCELYLTKQGTWCFITSPYGDHDILAQKKEFIKIPKLYHQNASSYYRIFQTKKEFNKYIEIREFPSLGDVK